MNKATYFLLTLLFYSSQSAAFSTKDTALGEQSTAIILVDNIKAKNRELPFTAEEATEMIFKAPLSVANFIKEISYNKTWLTGRVFNWLPIKGRGKCPSDKEVINRFLKKNSLNNFSRVVILFNNCKSLGLGKSTHGRKYFNTKKGFYNISISKVNLHHWLAVLKHPRKKLAKITGTVLAHELGHALGIRAHSNLLECKDRVSPANSNSLCQQKAISDMFTIMGGEGFYRASLHPSACHKQDLNWFSAKDLRTITPSTKKTYFDITLSPYELASTEYPKVLSINLPIPINVTKKVKISRLFIEYRTPRGFDSDLTLLSDAAENLYKGLIKDPKHYANNAKINIDGVQIRGGFFFKGHCATSYLLDPKPNTIQHTSGPYSLYDSLDGFLTTGEEFYEPINKLKVKVESVSSKREWVRLKVSL